MPEELEELEKWASKLRNLEGFVELPGSRARALVRGARNGEEVDLQEVKELISLYSKVHRELPEIVQTSKGKFFKGVTKVKKVISEDPVWAFMNWHRIAATANHNGFLYAQAKLVLTGVVQAEKEITDATKILYWNVEIDDPDIMRQVRERVVYEILERKGCPERKEEELRLENSTLIQDYFMLKGEVEDAFSYNRKAHLYVVPNIILEEKVLWEDVEKDEDADMLSLKGVSANELETLATLVADGGFFTLAQAFEVARALEES